MSTTCTVTATITDPSSTSLLGNAFVRFRLRNFTGFVPIVSGSNLICEDQIDAYPNPAGAISQVLTCNTAISPANTFYTCEFFNQGRIVSSANYYFNANTSLNTASNINPAPAPAGPSSIIFENNGVLNSSQTTLNLENTDGSIVITDEGSGTLNLQAVTTGFSTTGYGGFWSAGFPMMSMYVTSFTGGPIVSTAVNQVIVWQFLLETPITIRNLSSYVYSGSAGTTVNFGIYNAAGNKLIDSGALSIATTNAQLSVSIAPVVLPAGTYYFAASQSTDDGEVLAFNLNNIAAVTTVSAGGSGVAKIGVAANATSLGVMPSTLGTISLATYLSNATNMPAVFFAV